MEINKIIISKYETGWVINIKYDNVSITKEFFTPCFITYKERLFELHLDFIIEHKNENLTQYRNEEFKEILPLLLEHGKMLNRNSCPKEINYVKSN